MTRHTGGEPGLPEDVVAALRQGHKIEAIKRLREARGLDLKTAKEQVDAHLAEHPGLMPENAAASFNIIPLVAAAVIAAAVYYYFSQG